MNNSDRNVINVREEDKEFIKMVSQLSTEKVALIKGVVIGLQIQENEQKQIERNSLWNEK